MSCEEIAEEDDQSDGINLSRALEQRLRAAELMEIEVILVKKGVRTLSTSARLNLKERSDLLATTRQLWRILHMLQVTVDSCWRQTEQSPSHNAWSADNTWSSRQQ
jgi:hypothetical protein